MDKFYYAESIAVVGVSNRPNNLAARIIQNLHNHHYMGAIYPVGQSGGTYLGHHIYTSLDEIKFDVELAVILTPAPTIPNILRSCAQKGIKRVIIESGGFAELDERGAALSEELLQIAKENGMRFMGPNGIGTFNAKTGLCVGFPEFPDSMIGSTSVVAQSGGVGLVYLAEFMSESVGLAKFASVGNKLMLDEVDQLEYLIRDPETEKMVFYLESFKRGREFCRLIASTDKPVVVHKSNTSELSKSIAASHTTAMLSNDRVVDAALRQVGALRTNTIRGAIDGAKIFSLPPLRGTRLGIVSRSGGHAVIAADTCAARGFTLPPFDRQVLDRAQQYVRAGVIKLQNPLDLGDLFQIDTYKEILSDILNQPQIDGVVFLLAYHTSVPSELVMALVDHVEKIVKELGKPIALVIQSWPEEEAKMKRYTTFPIFDSAEEAVEAMYASLARQRCINRRRETIPKIKAGRKECAEIFEREKGQPHLGFTAYDILRAYGIPAAQTRFAASPKAAADAAAEVGYPVVLKVESPEASHKTDVDGVILRLNKPAEVKAAFGRLRDSLFEHNPKAHFDGVAVQPMAQKGMELFVGASRDRDFGPLVILGWGGTVAEALGLPIIRLAPISREEALRMIDELPARRLLDGIRKSPPMDVNALADIIARAAALIADQDGLEEMDLNPVRLYAKGKGAMVLDARMIPSRRK